MSWILFAICMLGCASDPVSPPPVESIEPAESADEVVHWNMDVNGVMMHGYDPVSYRSGEPQQGSDAFAMVWDGATWHFASAENRQKFAQDPSGYAPSLGGYCTFGIVIDKKLDGDPGVYWMQGEALYLFLNEEVRQTFMQDIDGNLQKVSVKWEQLINLSMQG
jgi:YHS domain-containing protein